MGGLLVESVWKTNTRNVVFLIASVLKRIMLLTDKIPCSALKLIYTIMFLAYYE